MRSTNAFRSLPVLVAAALAAPWWGCGNGQGPATELVDRARQAVFTNGDFEASAIGAVPAGWTVTTNINPLTTGITDTRPGPQTLASLNLQAGGLAETHVVGGALESQFDPDLGPTASLRFPKYGIRAAVVNYGDATNKGANENVNSMVQTMTAGNGDVDPADNKVHVRFAIAPVLLSGGHPYNQQPYYFVQLDDVTKGTILYQDFNASAQAGVPWKTFVDVNFETAYYTDWQLVDIAPGNAGLAVGDQIKLTVIASGCSQGGHYGRVYVDGVASSIPGLYVSATGPSVANDGADVSYRLSYKNGGTATAAGSSVTMVIPAGTVYKSNTGGCTGVAVGGTGTLTCSLGSQAAGASGAFDVVVTISAGTAAGTLITNGNYSIQATGISALLGPKVNTTVTTGVSYADVAITKTDGVAAIGWGQALTYTMVVSNAGPVAAGTVTVADAMPAQLTGVTWTCVGAGGGTCTASGSGSINTTASLPVGASATYTVQASVVAGSGSGSVVNTATATVGGGVTDPSSSNNTAVDTDAIGTLRTLSLAKTNPSGGSIASSPASISCGAGCSSASGAFLDGTTVVLTASPVTGASLSSWGGACASAGSASTCTVTMTGDQSVTATFALPTLTVTAGNNQGAALGTAFGTALQVRALDSSGNPMSGATVSFAAPGSGASATVAATATTNASGFASVAATAGGTAGAYTITASLPGAISKSVSLWNYGAAASITVVSGNNQSATVATAFGAPLVVVVRDAASQPVVGAAVTFAAPVSGARATLGTASTTTGAGGQASTTATAGQVAGGYAVTATATGVATPVSVSLTNTAGAAAAITASGGNAQSTLISTAFAGPLLVTVRDTFANAVSGATVTFSAPGSGASASFGAVATTDASGQTSAVATANSVLGGYNATASVTGVTPSATFALTNFGVLVIAPTTITLAPRGGITFTASGDPAAGYIFDIATNASGGSINASTGAYSAGPTGGVSDIVRVTDSMSRTATATVTVSPGVTVTPAAASVVPRASRSFSASGGSGTGYVFALSTNASGGTINAGTGAYTAGTTPNVTDVITVTDSFANIGSASVAVGAGVSLAPSGATAPPRGPLAFTASGGSGTGYVYAFTTNASGGSLNASTGAYTAGSIPSVTDVVRVTDSLGNTATANATVGPGLSLAPAAPTTSPRGQVVLTASGGSGAGYAFALSTNASGGIINASTGAYTAGATGSTTDVATVTDSLGNTKSVSITVSGGLAITPASPAVAPRESKTFTASGGSGSGYLFALSTNASAGTIDATTGAYVAGATGSTSDVITVTDSLGNTVSATAHVGPGVRVAPAMGSLAPLGALTFTATGGSGSGYAFALTTNASGGTIDATTGAYLAGATGGVTDTVTVTDSLGNAGTATAVVGAGIVLSPASPTTPPKGTVAFSATGGSGLGYLYAVTANASGATVDAAGNYTAGAVGGVTDMVTVTDSLGNTAAQPIIVGPALSLLGSGAATPPRGSLTFTVSGGSGSGYVFSLASNASGATIGTSPGASTGAYTAGSAPSSTDVIRVTDSLGNTATANVAVGPGIALAPASPAAAPRGQVTLTATGGSGTGYVYAITTNASGGSVNATTGSYTAGPTGNTADVVTVTDSLGNTASVAVSVGGGLVVTPSSPKVAPREGRTFSAAGGSGVGYTFTLSTNGSGGTIRAADGVYKAGPTGGTTDVITATDSLGNMASATVQVGPGLSVTPAAMPSLAPLGAIAFSVAGGSGDYTFTLLTNASGGSIDATTGAYTAGSTGDTTDIVQVTDSLGNSVTVTITITAGLRPVASTMTLPPRGTATLAATGGAGPYRFALTVNGSGATLDPMTGAYVAGTTVGSNDLITVTDANGAATTVSVKVGPGVSLLPAAPAVAPRTALTFTATGGSETGYHYTLPTNASGGSIDPDSGAYRAGATAGVVDVVAVTDALGNSASVTVAVGNGLAINPGAPVVAPRGALTFTAAGGSGTGYTFALATNMSGATIDAATGAYHAGPTPSVTDGVTVTDSAGNSAAASISVGAGVTVAPAQTSVAPRGAIALAASGGSGTGYTFTLTGNPSGATIDAATGRYVAGATPDVTDSVTVTDSLGNGAVATIAVQDGVTINAPTRQTPPRGTLALTASGGSGRYTFALKVNGSGATVVATTGAYTAGTTAASTDSVQVTDDLGNSAVINITVGAGVTLTPASPSAPPSGALAFTAQGGSGAGYVFAITSNGSGATVDATTGAYNAGDTADAADTVTVTDSLGNTANVSVSVGGGVTLNPPTPTVSPRGAVTFTASGGSGVGYVFSLVGDGSGATIDAATGVYNAGALGDVTDRVKVVDSLGKAATAEVTVGPGVSITPATTAVAPFADVDFAVAGGSGTGYVFTLAAGGSGGTIDATTGRYRAGATGGTSDKVTVTDSLGNVASATVNVGAALVAGTSGSRMLPPRGTLRITAVGGASPYSFAVTTNGSGGRVNPSTGEYVAGAAGNTEDVVTISDAHGATSAITIDVGPAVSITPESPAVTAGGSVPLSATGGSDTGYVWSVVSHGAGGSVDAATGIYTAARNSAPGASDVVRVVDSLGNSALVTISPKVIDVSASGGGHGCDCSTAPTTPEGGLGTAGGVLALVCVATARRRRRRTTTVSSAPPGHL